MKVYANYVEPERYPDFKKRKFEVVTHSALQNKVQFSSARFFHVDTDMNKFLNIENDIQLYTKNYKIGNCFWINWKAITVANIHELIDRIADKDLYLYGFWGFVPGAKADKQNQQWGEFVIDGELNDYINKKLGNHFFGYELGEHDGRYMGSYAGRKSNTYSGEGRLDQYKNFHRFFSKIGDSLHNKITVLSTLTFMHYHARECNVSFLGCESAQALLNTQMWYAFVRGASKQYGILCFGNVSVWNRWGYKTYESCGGYDVQTAKLKWGVGCGTSLSLMRRIIYSHYMYNCDLIGIEQSQFTDDNTENHIENKKSSNTNIEIYGKLSPIGILQQQVNFFTEENGKPGVMYTPFAILMDSFAGWMPPRSIYSTEIYKVWGNLPYNKGDHQTHVLFEMFFPQYENSGFYHNETGYLTATPYGEICDVLLSDVDINVISRYQTMIVVNGTQLNHELYCKLKRFVSMGGRVILFADTVKKYRSENERFDEAYLSFFGLEALGKNIKLENAEAEYDGNKYSVSSLEVAECTVSDGVVKAECNGMPLIVENSFNMGCVTTVLALDCLEQVDDEPLAVNEIDTNISSPYDFSLFFKTYLADEFNKLVIVRPTNKRLQYIVNVKGENSLRVMVCNNTHIKQNYGFEAGNGTVIKSITRITGDNVVKDAQGYYPEDFECNFTATSGEGEYSLEISDIDIFDIELSSSLSLAEEINPKEPENRVYIRKIGAFSSIEDFVLATPTVKQSFSGVMVEADYFENLDVNFIEKEAAFLKRVGVKIVVDLSPMLNIYPDLSFQGNFHERREESYARLDDILDKIFCYDCEAIIVSSMPMPEGCSELEELKKSMYEVYDYLLNRAETKRIKIIFQNKPIVFSTHEGYDTACRNEEIKLGFNTCGGICTDTDFESIFEAYHIDCLIVSAPERDVFGQYYHSGAPVCGSVAEQEIREIVEVYSLNNDGIIILDAKYADYSQAFADYNLLFGE